MSRVLIVGDKIAEKFGAQLRAAGERDAMRIISRGLNRGGGQAFTAVKRSLAAQTGIAYQNIQFATKEVKSTPGSLAYSIVASGSETNLNLFKARQLKRGVSAAPWEKRRQFRSTFLVPAYGGLVFRREGKPRGPLDPLFGPNIAREIVRAPTIGKWIQAEGYIVNNVAHDLARLFAGKR